MHWIYSVATDVVGYLVELVSGQSYAGFVREKILKPLGMADTGFWVPETRRDRFAACYMFKDGRLELFDDSQNSNYFAAPRTAIGWRRTGGHGERLSALLPHVAGAGRTGRREASVAQDGRLDDRQSAARRVRRSQNCRPPPMPSTRPAIAASVLVWASR